MISIKKIGARYELRSQYDPAIIEAVKACGGRWDPDVRAWWFAHASGARAAAELLRESGHTVVADLADRNSSPGPATVTAESMFAALFALLSADHGKRVYWVLAQALHPDHGGDTEVMKALTAAWKRQPKRAAP